MRQKLKSVLYSSPMIVIMILTLLLLTYVGFGEAKRQYTVFQLRKLIIEGEIVRNAFDTYLKAGLPLKQFSGFSVTSDLLLRSDSMIENIRVTNTKGDIVFLKARSEMSKSAFIKNPDQREYKKIEIEKRTNQLFEIEESKESFQIIQTLRNKFGIVGYVFTEAPKNRLLLFLNQEYVVVFYFLVGLSLLFTAIVFIFEIFIGKKRYRQRVLQTGYFIVFLLFSSIIGITVHKIYQQGAAASTKALSDSITQRLAAIMELGIEIQDIKGIDQVFRQYKAGNPDIETIAITEDGVIISHNDPGFIGQPYVKPEQSLEYENILVGTQNRDKKEFRVTVTMPTGIITNAVLGSSKTFIVLFIACGLISMVFLNAGSAIIDVIDRDSYESDKEKSLLELINEICDDSIITEKEKERLAKKLHEHPNLTNREQERLDNYYRRIENGTLIQKNRLDLNFEIGLNLIQPAYFLIVFVNALSISFLPQLVLGFADKSISSLAIVSFPFTAYYLLFALVLVPAGQYAEKGNLKKLLACGFLAEVVGLTLVAVSDGFWLLTLGRMASGIGQGFFLIGLQSYVLAVTPKGKRSLGHAVKVIGRNSGLIAGTAIGALLYSYINYKGVFFLASAITIFALLYLVVLVPNVEEISGAVKTEEKNGTELQENAFAKLFKNILAVLKDGEFIKTLFTIGIVGKISIAGVVMFAVPLLLSKKGFATEDIGLFLMLYYISGMLTTKFAAKFVDTPGVTRWVLSMSAVIGGLSSLFLGFIGISGLLEQAAIPGINLLAYLAMGFNKGLAGVGLSGNDSYLILFFIILMGVSNGLLAAPIMTHIGNLKIAERHGVKTVSATYVFLERFGHVAGPAVIGYLIAANGGSTLAVSFFGVITIVFGVVFAIITHNKD